MGGAEQTDDTYGSDVPVWQEFREAKSGNEGKVYGGCNEDATMRRLKGDCNGG